MNTVQEASEVIDPAIAARMKSIKQHFYELDQLARQIPRLQLCEEYSKELRNAIVDFGEQRQAIADQFSKMISPIMTALSEIGTPTADSPNTARVFEEVAVVRDNRLVSLERAASLCSNCHDLAARCVDEMKPVVSDLRTALDSTLSDVKKDLERIGQGLESTVAGIQGVNASAAELQLNGLARQNIRTRKAWVKLEDAKARLARATNATVGSKRQCAKIRAELSRITASEIRL